MKRNHRQWFRKLAEQGKVGSICRRRLSFAVDYLADGYAFSRYQGNEGKTAVLIHGWGVRASSMESLAEMLYRAGYSVLNYDYPSSEKSIRQHAGRFLSCYRREHLRGKIHFLTHSMGGLILRRALAEMTEAECRAIDSIVMLGPPNQGSLLALIGKAGPVRSLNVSLGDMVPGSDALRIPAPRYLPPVGIIAGTLDGKVAFKSTALPGGLPCQRTSICCTHPGLRDPRNTGILIQYFFQHKTFQV